MNILFTARTTESVIQSEETMFGSIFLPTQSPLFPVHSFIVVAHTHTFRSFEGTRHPTPSLDLLLFNLLLCFGKSSLHNAALMHH